MPEIRILPENLVNQIAAGEVIERAASVLKELIDNSIDAGATEIEIVIHSHGKKLVQVADNGCGMTRNELELALERHATSKLRTSADLFEIKSLGFRGEALPSIASVSSLEISSRPHDSASGTLMRIEGGRKVHEEPFAGPSGTSISVHSLFFNTPAREKFLKSPATELAHIVRVFKQYALAYPEIIWTFSHEDGLRYKLPAGGLNIRLDDLYGAGFTDKLLDIEFHQGGVNVSGVIGKKELNKKSRGDQYLFINRRPIQSSALHGAIATAMRELLEDREWPFYVLQFDIDPKLIDVNVHPTKQEVRFSEARLVSAAAYKAVRDAIPAQAASLRPPQIGLEAIESEKSHPADRLGGSVVPPEFRSTFSPSKGATESLPLSLSKPDAAAATRGVAPIQQPPIQSIRPAIYQIHNKYLISPITSGLAIIDQHAAHERILYERALRSFDERSFSSQQLLFPLLLELDAEEDAILQEIRDDLASLGFKIRDFGPRSYSIEAVPAGLRRASEVSMIRETIAEYEDFRRANFAPRDALAAGFACKAAIRTGDSLSEAEMNALVDELFTTRHPLSCPHGRPTYIELKLTELDYRFKRTG
ncbi:DNA mismatch repair endonuclease MutL [bacterium]|nr:MAG: DNA mismatch repair endonuclease MutL [bacterium]